MTLESSGTVADVPAGVNLAAYRVVQESLTNVIKHGGPVAHVRISCGENGIEVEVTDDGRAGGAPRAATERWVGPRSAGDARARRALRRAVRGGTPPGGRLPVRARLPYAGGSS